MIDIHNHLIPGVDDGSQSLEESIEMIEKFKHSGYTGAICTSHYYPQRYLVNSDRVIKGIDTLKAECLARGIEFELYPGNEIFLDGNALTAVETGEALSLNNSRYLLVELPFLTKPNYARDFIYRLQLKGFVVILAHCERYSYVQDDPDWLLDHIKSGCLIQVNLNSIKSSPGSSVYVTLDKLLKKNMVHLVATDAHSSEMRSPDVAHELELFKARMGEDWFQRVVIRNPRRIIENEFISSDFDGIIGDQVKEEPKRAGFFKKLFRRGE